MGQQQILITVLVVIIIGIASIVAINTMQGARKDANESALRQDILMILNDAQVYYHKPATMGGGGNSFNSISEDHILSIDPTNENATYSITGNANRVIVRGISFLDNDTLTAKATIQGSKMDIQWRNNE